MTRSPVCGGRGTSRWWNGRSARSRVPAGRPVRPICGNGSPCATTRCCGNWGHGSDGLIGAGTKRCGTKEWQMAVSIDAEKDAVLREAARYGAEVAPAGILGRADAHAAPVTPDAADLLGYFRMYYRHVAPDDLVGRAPERVAAVPLEHSSLRAPIPHRPALVPLRAP